MSITGVTPHTSAPSSRSLSVALGSARPLTGRKCVGSGEICDFCEAPITRSSSEFRVDAELNGERLTLHFHGRCYAQWWAVPGVASQPLT